VAELRRLLGYMRPYLDQMSTAAVMLPVAGAMMTLVAATSCAMTTPAIPIFSDGFETGDTMGWSSSMP
jgi:hypothetical protein